MYRIIFHLDMEAFEASVEQHDNPTLSGTQLKPDRLIWRLR